MKNKIEVRDFSFYYGDFKALESITLDIKANQITALIGPSGCGKSTFLRSLNRMNDTISGVRADGKVLLDGQDEVLAAGGRIPALRPGQILQHGADDVLVAADEANQHVARQIPDVPEEIHVVSFGFGWILFARRRVSRTIDC